MFIGAAEAVPFLIQKRFICQDIKPISFWFELAHSEINRIASVNDEVTMFDMKMTLGMFECLYYLNSDRNKLRESYSILNSLFIDYSNHNNKNVVTKFHFLLLSLVIGYYDKNCKDLVDMSIKSIDERWNELSSLKEILDFQILTYNCLTIEKNDSKFDVRFVYDIYKNSFTKSINKFIGLGRDLHAAFLNKVVYEILIPDNNYNEALVIIEDAIYA